MVKMKRKFSGGALAFFFFLACAGREVPSSGVFVPEELKGAQELNSPAAYTGKRLVIRGEQIFPSNPSQYEIRKDDGDRSSSRENQGNGLHRMGRRRHLSRDRHGGT
jgi:hypothetical protein